MPPSVDQLILKIVHDISVPGVQVIDVPKIISQDSIPHRAVLRVPQLVEQLVDVPVPRWVTLARGRETAGQAWSRIWEPTGSTEAGHTAHPVDHPGRIHRQPRAVSKYWAGLGRTASSHWWTFLLATETGFAVPQTQCIDGVVVLPVEVVHTGRTVWKTVEISVVVGNVPVIMQRQFWQSFWYMSEMPQIQFIDRVLRSVARQRRAFTV